MIPIRNGLRRWHQEAQYLHSLPKRPKMRSLQANQNQKGSSEKTNWGNSTSGRNIREVDNCKVNEGGDRYAVVVQDLQKTSFLLLSQDCLQAQARVRLLHRSRRAHRVPLRVQQDYEVTILMTKHRETGVVLPKSKTKEKRTTIKQWEIDCAISQDFTDDLEDTDVPALANTSHDWDSERPAKVVFTKHST